MELGSDLLGEEITRAIQRAQDNVEDKQREVATQALGTDPIGSMETRLDESFDAYRRSMEARLEMLDRLIDGFD